MDTRIHHSIFHVFLFVLSYQCNVHVYVATSTWSLLSFKQPRTHFHIPPKSPQAIMWNGFTWWKVYLIWCSNCSTDIIHPAELKSIEWSNRWKLQRSEIFSEPQRSSIVVCRLSIYFTYRRISPTSFINSTLCKFYLTARFNVL